VPPLAFSPTLLAFPGARPGFAGGPDVCRCPLPAERTLMLPMGPASDLLGAEGHHRFGARLAAGCGPNVDTLPARDELG